MSSWEIFVALSDQNFLLPHRFRIVESPTPARLITSPCYRSTCHVGKYSLQIVSLSDLEYERVFFGGFLYLRLWKISVLKRNSGLAAICKNAGSFHELFGDVENQIVQCFRTIVRAVDQRKVPNCFFLFFHT